MMEILHEIESTSSLKKGLLDDYLVALGSALAPAEQRVSLGASMATQQQVETILGPDNRTQTTEDLRFIC